MADDDKRDQPAEAAFESARSAAGGSVLERILAGMAALGRAEAVSLRKRRHADTKRYAARLIHKAASGHQSVEEWLALCAAPTKRDRRIAQIAKRFLSRRRHAAVVLEAA